MTNNDNPHTETRRRIGMAYLLATNPETFDLIAKNNINLFHGTNANALPNILKYGMNSEEELLKNGLDILTGEQWSRIQSRKRDFISFTDNLDTAEEYASIIPSKDGDKSTSFEVIIGLSLNDVENLNVSRVSSDVPEVGFNGNIPFKYIKFLGVPESKVDFVKKLVNDDKVIVSAIDMRNKFYYMDDLCTEIYTEKVREFIEGKKQPEKSFDCEDAKTLVKTRNKTGILNIFDKKILGKEKDNENEIDSR